MTPAEVSALSDEDLNKACAERVMGWRLAVGLEPPTWIVWTDRMTSTNHYLDASDWSPATSLADAAMCTEAMLAKGLTMRMSFADGKVYVSFDKTFPRTDWTDYLNSDKGPTETRTIVIVIAATEARARAEAALLAALKGGDTIS